MVGDTGQEDRGLPGGVAPADDGRVVAVAEVGFDRGGGVVDPTAFESVDIGQGRLRYRAPVARMTVCARTWVPSSNSRR